MSKKKKTPTKVLSLEQIFPYAYGEEDQYGNPLYGTPNPDPETNYKYYRNEPQFVPEYAIRGTRPEEVVYADGTRLTPKNETTYDEVMGKVKRLPAPGADSPLAVRAYNIAAEEVDPEVAEYNRQTEGQHGGDYKQSQYTRTIARGKGIKDIASPFPYGSTKEERQRIKRIQREFSDYVDNLQGAAQPMAVENDLPVQPVRTAPPVPPEPRTATAPTGGGGWPFPVPPETPTEATAPAWSPPAWAAQIDAPTPARGRGPLMPPGAKPPAPTAAPAQRDLPYWEDVLTMRDASGRLVYPEDSNEYKQSIKEQDRAWVLKFYADRGIPLQPFNLAPDMPEDWSAHREYIEADSFPDPNSPGGRFHSRDPGGRNQTKRPNAPGPWPRGGRAPVPQPGAAPARGPAQQQTPLTADPAAPNTLRERQRAAMGPQPGDDYTGESGVAAGSEEERKLRYNAGVAQETRERLAAYGHDLDRESRAASSFGRGMDNVTAAQAQKAADEQAAWDKRMAGERAISDRERERFGRLGGVMSAVPTGAAPGTAGQFGPDRTHEFPNSIAMAESNQRSPSPALTPLQIKNRENRTQLEDERARKGLDSLIDRVAAASGVTKQEAQAMFDERVVQLKLNPATMSRAEIHQAMQPVHRIRKNNQAESEAVRRERYTNQMMLAGSNKGKNEANMFTALPKEWQNVVAATRLSRANATTPLDAQTEAGKAQAAAEARLNDPDPLKALIAQQQLAAMERDKAERYDRKATEIDGKVAKLVDYSAYPHTPAVLNSRKKKLKDLYGPEFHELIDSLFDEPIRVSQAYQDKFAQEPFQAPPAEPPSK